MPETVIPPQTVPQGIIAAEAVAAGLTNPAAASHIIAPITPPVNLSSNPAAQAAEDAAAAANHAATLPIVSGGTPFNIPAGNPVFTVPGNPNVIDYNAERTWFETQYGKDPLGILSPSETAQPGSPTTPVTNATLAGFFTPYPVIPIVQTVRADVEDTKVKH